MTPRRQSTFSRIKICGITNVDDARAAVDAGADAVGLVFAESPRRVDEDTASAIATAVPAFVNVVGVFMDQPMETVAKIAQRAGLDAVQLHGSESPDECSRLQGKVIKRLAVTDADSTESLREKSRAFSGQLILLDPGAGSGRVFDWRIARDLAWPLVISGGLTPENVGRAIELAAPFGVDVSSGVERSPGIKDRARLREFVMSVRKADEHLGRE